jgi:hypothetical protein
MVAERDPDGVVTQQAAADDDLGDAADDDADDLGSMASFFRAAASAPPAAQPIAVGRTLDRYQVTAVIGQGGMGVVYEAHDLRLDRRVALKCLPGELVGDKDRQRRFLREAMVTASLEHPGSSRCTTPVSAPASCTTRCAGSPGARSSR